MVRWEEENPLQEQPALADIPAISYGDDAAANKFCYTPCKIVGMFYHVQKSLVCDNDEFFAVVWPCSYVCEKSSVFTSKWNLNYVYNNQRTKLPDLQVINCDSIVRQCLMIPEILENEQGSAVYHEVWPRELWCEEF